MPGFISKQTIGKHIYLDETVSFWNKEKKYSDNRKVRIGKIDPVTGETFWKKAYVDRLAEEGKDVGGMLIWGTEGEYAKSLLDKNAGRDAQRTGARKALASVRDFGAVHLLSEIAKKTGVASAAESSLPGLWREILDMAYYLVISAKPVMYCDDFAEASDGLASGSMSSQRASDLFARIGDEDRTAFYKEWYARMREREYVALDITSVSTYSEGIEAAEYGHNRDGERLPQVNVCMLFGQSSRLPAYQTLYSGSLGDVTTLRTTMEELSGVTDDAGDITLVMDKGFFSAKNVNAMLDAGIRFLVPVPFTSKLATGLVASEKKDIDQIGNTIATLGAPVRGVCKERAWGKDGATLHAHAFFDVMKATKERNELYGYVKSLADYAREHPLDSKRQAEYGRYLNVRRSKASGWTVSVKEDVVAAEVERTGWLILISNDINDAQAALDIYRAKDVVEKAFERYKDSLGMGRLRVHGDRRMMGKTLVAFVALVLSSHIHKVMKENDLYKTMTFDRLLMTMAKLKSAKVGGKRILRPITKEQKEIYKAFGIKPPKSALD
jgi:hypothetical protein